jgi:hypothetical protein
LIDRIEIDGKQHEMFPHGTSWLEYPENDKTIERGVLIGQSEKDNRSHQLMPTSKDIEKLNVAFKINANNPNDPTLCLSSSVWTLVKKAEQNSMPFKRR